MWFFPLFMSLSRRENLKIYGLEYQENETKAQLEHKIVELFGNKLDVDEKNSDISVCHRLPKRRNDMPPAITVRFVARNFKQVNLYSISKLKEQSADVFSSEDITLARNKALMQLEKKQLSCVVICDGNLHCHMKNNQSQK